VYSQERADRNIWRVRLTASEDEAGAPAIAFASTYLEKQPRPSPDGKQIVFASSRSGSEEIWICDRDGSHPKQLTHFGGMPVGSPHWSPDGTQIVFDGFPRGSGEIYVMAAKPSVAIRLTNDNYQDFSPSWSRDGRWIYFVSSRSGDRQVWKIRADSPTPLEAVQTTKGGASFGPDESWDGESVYYLKQGELWSVPSAGGQERSAVDFTDKIAGYALGRHGIYLLGQSASHLNLISYVSFHSGHATRVLSIQKPIAHLAVLPGDSLLYTQADEEAADLMLVEHFR
jgi:Tol biopolymer transport system component